MSGPEDINLIPPEPADVEPTEKVESIESAKLIKDEVIRDIKRLGMNDPASVDLLQRYADQCEAEYVEQGRTDARQEALREKANVLAKSEYYFWAIKVMEEVLSIATTEDDKESIEESERIIDILSERWTQSYTRPPAPEKASTIEPTEVESGEQPSLEQEFAIPESIDLKPEEISKIVGREDSILDKKGIHFTPDYFKILFLQCDIKDLTDYDAIANTVFAKHISLKKAENEGIDATELQSQKMVDLAFRVDVITKYINKNGLNKFAISLVEEWRAQSLRWVESTGEKRAQMVHNLKLMDMYTAGSDTDIVMQIGKETYDIAVKEGYDDVVDYIKKLYNIG